MDGPDPRSALAPAARLRNGARVPLKFLLHTMVGCGRQHLLLRLPWVVLAGVRVALDILGYSKRAQSLCSVVQMAWRMGVLCLLLACDDPLHGALGPSMDVPDRSCSLCPVRTRGEPSHHHV